MKRSTYKMYGFSPVCKMLALAVTLAGPAATASIASAADSEPPPGARPMTAIELYTLYRDKSWRWDNGAGRMESANRRFTARVKDDKGKGKVRAEGRWMITDTGRLCLKANWHTATGTYPAKNCFAHRIDGATIYQKREPDGQWYVFRHANGRKDDEARKLVSIASVPLQRNERSDDSAEHKPIANATAKTDE